MKKLQLVSCLGCSILLMTELARAQTSAVDIVRVYPAILCEATSAQNSSHLADVAYVGICKEGANRKINWNISTVTMVTYSSQAKALRYYPAEEVDIRTAFPQNIGLLRYRPGSELNEATGRVTFQTSPLGDWGGYVSSFNPDVPELILSNCRRTPFN